MVSPISIPGFPSVHTRQSAATCDAALESRLASLEACVAALPSLITAAIDQAFADSLTQFRHDMFFRGAGEGISTPLAGDHHGSPAIDPIQLTRRPICAEGAQSQLSMSAVQAPPQLSSSPLLQALATSAVKPHSKDSDAATVLLPESKTGIHASTMTSAPRLLHEHSFPDTTKTGSTVLLLFGVTACYTGHSAFVYHAFLNAKYGWVNWYFVGKFVKKDFYALELFEEMSKRLNTYNMSLSSNLDAWDIVEDVAIAYEYNNITMRNQIPKSEPASLKPLTLNEFTELIRLEIAVNGYTEVLTFILGSWQEIFPMSNYKDDKDVAKLKEIGESFIIEGNPESCTSWLSMSGKVLATGDKLMYLPCGLAAGSSITVVGSSHYAHAEYVSQLAKLRWGDGTVMVLQFMDELLTHGGQPYDNIVVLVCRYLPKDLAASFTEENGTLGHINAIKQFLCLSLLHICAFTVMAISQLDYSIFTSLLSKLNQELCHRVDVHLDAVFFPNCIANDQIFQQPGWCHTLTDPCDNISYQRVVFNQRNKFNQRNYKIWLMERPCILLSFTVVEQNGKRKGFGFVQFDKEDSAMPATNALNATISKGKNLYVSIFVQNSKNDNKLRIFSNTPNLVLYQEVVCYTGLQLAKNITEACNNRVFGQIVLLRVQIVTTLIRLSEEYANLKGHQDGHFRQEEEVFAILSRKHRNDPLKIKAKLFPYNFQKLLPTVLFLPLVIEQDNAWKIAILFCDAALDTIVLQFLLELLGVRKASVGIVKGERATNENVPDIKTWAILFEDHCFMVTEMLYLVEMNQHFLDDAYLSDALPLNPRKSLIAQTSYFKKVISMVANNLTSSFNLEIAVKLLFQEDGTTTASILFFLFHVMHFKERGKSGTKEHSGGNITEAMFLIVNTNVPSVQESSITQYMAELARHVIMVSSAPTLPAIIGKSYNTTKLAIKEIMLELRADKMGSDVSASKANGYTPLMLATGGCPATLCEFLITLGGKCDVANARHETARLLARKIGIKNYAENMILDELESIIVFVVWKYIQLRSTFLGGFMIAFVQGWRLTVVLLATIPAIVIAGAIMATIMSKISSRGQSAYVEAGNMVEQTVGSIRTVAAFTGEKQAIEKYSQFFFFNLEDKVVLKG